MTAGAELIGWWAALTALWLVLVSHLDTLERAVGAACAFLAACAACGVRRAAGRR